MSLLRRRRHTAPRYETPDGVFVPGAWTDPWPRDHPTHAELMTLWVTIARAKGYLIHYTHDSRSEGWGADSGWPDLFLVRNGRAFAIELKTPGYNDPTDEQVRWLGALGHIPGVFDGIFRSSGDKARDMAVIADILSTPPPTLPRAEGHL